jgi:hypothetical protein
VRKGDLGAKDELFYYCKRYWLTTDWEHLGNTSKCTTWGSENNTSDCSKEWAVVCSGK